MYSQDENVLFIHVPKTGGKAVAEVFGVKSHTHLTYLQAQKYYSLKNKSDRPYTFTFIREPHERFVSAFKQLVEKKNKRQFKKFTRFDPASFQLWVKSVWFPHYCGYEIEVDDIAMQKWVNCEMNPSHPHGFNPDTYSIYLENKDGWPSNSIDKMLDFRNPLSEMKLLNNNLNSRDSLESISFELSKIRESNLGSYSHFWDSESKEMFESLAKSDIKFYERFHNVQ